MLDRYNPIINLTESFFLQNINEIIKDPGQKTTYEVAIFASDTWKKVPCA